MTADPKRMAYVQAALGRGHGEFTDANGVLWLIDDMAYPKSRAEYHRLLRQPGAEWRGEFEDGRRVVHLAVADPLAQRREFTPRHDWARGRTYQFMPGDDHSVQPIVLAEQLRRSRAVGSFPNAGRSTS